MTILVRSFFGFPYLPSALIGKKESGQPSIIGSPFLAVPSHPSFSVGCDRGASVLVVCSVSLWWLPFARGWGSWIPSSLVKLGWGVAVEAVFVLCVRVVAAGFELWCYWVKLLLVVCGAVWVVAAGFELWCYWVKLLLVVCGAIWVVAVSRFTTGVTRLNRGSLLVCGTVYESGSWYFVFGSGWSSCGDCDF
ncbi:hypothetical protein ACOSQ3_021070 [Xanthoceras sorbifolium]